jgi:uncharacterized membrane protein
MSNGPAFRDLGRILVVLGIVLVAVGALLSFLSRRGGLRRLPGDFLYRGERVTIFFPIVTCIVLSLLLTLILNLFFRR